TDGDVGQFCALALHGGLPQVAYYDATNKDLWWGAWDGSSWTRELADSSGDVGKGCNLGLRGQGEPRISYYDATHGDLRMAGRSLAGGWTVSNVDTVQDVGRVSAIWVDQETGLSEIAYYDATARRVKYAEEKPATTSVGPAKGTGMEARLSV